MADVLPGETGSGEVWVRYFAAAAEASGLDEERIALNPKTLGALRADLLDRYGESMAKVLRSGSFLLDGVVSRDPEKALGERVDVLPPFAGG